MYMGIQAGNGSRKLFQSKVAVKAAVSLALGHCVYFITV